MTLNDILAGLPGTIVNRFSASNSAFWLAKCSDILSDLDTLCPGPWMVDEVHALPMASGFIKKPFCMSRIKGCRVVLQDGSAIIDKECVKEFNDLGIALNDYPKSLLSYSSEKIEVSAADDESITIYGYGDADKASGDGDMSISSGEDYSDISMAGEVVLPYTFDRRKPGRVFAKKDGILFSSNVIVTGYMKTPKPASLSDSLMLPSEWDHLVQAGLRWKAELDMSPASSDAIVCGKLYSNAVKEYRSKMTMGQGTIHRPHFQGATLRMDTF